MTSETHSRRVRVPAAAVIALAIVVALALGYAGSRGLLARPAAPMERLRIALPAVPHAALLHIAAAKGYFAEEGLDVTVTRVSHGKAGIDLLAQDKVDLAAAAEVPFVIAVLKGEPLGIAATLVSVSNVMEVVARRDRAIAAPRDLSGKRVGVTFGTSGDYSLWAFLIRYRLAPNSVTMVDLLPGQMVRELASGTIDAVSTWEPIKSNAQAALADNALSFTEPDAYTGIFAVIGRSEFLKARAGTIEKVVRALLKAEAFNRAEPEKALALEGRREDLGAGLEGLRVQSRLASIAARHPGRRSALGDGARIRRQRPGPEFPAAPAPRRAAGCATRACDGRALGLAMKISTKGRLATTTALATIGLIAGMIWWANKEVEDADSKRRQTTELARGLTELRLVAFEYMLHRHERARQQEHEVSARLDRLIANNPISGTEQSEVLAHLRERSATTHRLFGELVSAPVADGANAADDESIRRFEAQLSSRLLILQQESTADAFRLTDFSTERINAAQQRVVIVILAGLALIALSTGVAAWLINRNVLAPIGRLKQATREVAAGNWNYKLDIGSGDEIGEMSRNFDAMTHSLRMSFAQIERSNQELAALNQEIEAFSYSVSHDLRGPLRSMDGFSLALLEDYGDKLDDEGKDSLQRIRAASQRMGRLIDDLLRLSGVTRAELTLKPINLSEIAREIADSLDQQQPARAVQWVIEEGMMVHADKALIQIAMQNLLENAWKFTGKTDKPVIRVCALERDGKKVCFVADNGVGFDMAYADRLFGAFQRLHHESEFSGTGIGLAIVQRIFRRHEGKIWAQAKPGLGATFFFSLKEHGHE